jgi:hypothetical protein
MRDSDATETTQRYAVFITWIVNRWHGVTKSFQEKLAMADQEHGEEGGESLA